MNTAEISNAQLNVSKYYTVEHITDLINKININDNSNAFYNLETKSIDVEIADISDIENHVLGIRGIIDLWLTQLPANESDIQIIRDNIDFVFNITQITNPINNEPLIKVYLY